MLNELRLQDFSGLLDLGGNQVKVDVMRILLILLTLTSSVDATANSGDRKTMVSMKTDALPIPLEHRHTLLMTLNRSYSPPDFAAEGQRFHTPPNNTANGLSSAGNEMLLFTSDFLRRELDRRLRIINQTRGHSDFDDKPFINTEHFWAKIKTYPIHLNDDDNPDWVYAIEASSGFLDIKEYVLVFTLSKRDTSKRNGNRFNQSFINYKNTDGVVAYVPRAIDGAFTITHGAPVASNTKTGTDCLTAKTLEFNGQFDRTYKYEFFQEMIRGKCAGTYLGEIE